MKGFIIFLRAWKGGHRAAKATPSKREEAAYSRGADFWGIV